MGTKDQRNAALQEIARQRAVKEERRRARLIAAGSTVTEIPAQQSRNSGPGHCQASASSLTDSLAALSLCQPVEQRPASAIDLCSSSSSSDSEPAASHRLVQWAETPGRPAVLPPDVPAPAVIPGAELSQAASSQQPADGPDEADLVLGDQQQYRLPGHIAARLYPHQLEGVRWLFSLKSGGCMADDMGLGKASLQCRPPG